MRLPKNLLWHARRDSAAGRLAARRLAALPLALLLAIALSLPTARQAMALSDYRAAIVVDMNSGRTLFQYNADARRVPASLTKLMTLYILFGYLRDGRIGMDTPLVVTPHAAAQAPTKLNLKPGQTIRVEDAIEGLVTQSANDAAVTVAENIAGTESNFARMMTREARLLGMTNTVYHNASGLPCDEAQLTSARDLVILSEHLMRDYPQYYHFFSLKYFTYKGRHYHNHNHLLINYPGTDGMKTGYTRAAGFNLVVSVHRNGKHLLAVILGGHTSRGRDATMRYLLNKYFPAATVGYGTQQLVAEASPGMPLPRPPVPHAMTATASSAPLPAAAAASADMPAARTVQTISYRSDAGAAAVPQPPEPPVAEPVPLPSSAAGPYQVQVGSYPSPQQAQTRLSSVEDKAGRLLRGHEPVTTSFQDGSTQWYRARFAGFSQSAAAETCDRLKRLSVDCIAMKTD